MALRHDLQIGIRTWARTPALASVAILTLAIGIGATATAFSLAYSVLVRPFPFPDADRLVWITSYNARTSDGRELVDNSNRMSQVLDWQEHARSFEQLAAWSGTASPDIYTVTGVGDPERVKGLRVTQQLMLLLGATPALGRLFVPGDDDVDAARTVILSYGYWQQRFGGWPDVIGQSINVENLAHSIAGVSLPGQPFRPDEGGAFVRMVSPRYFETVGIRIVSGRDFEPADRPHTRLVVAINETLARRVGAYGRTPLGARLNVSGRVREVVAIVVDVKSQTLARAAEAEVYVPYTQQPGWRAYDIVARAAGDPAAVVPSIRAAVWRVDRDQAIGTPVALRALIDRTLISHRLLSSLIGAFAAAALLLSALGIYGVVGYRVVQRTKEIAIRIALGAPRWRVTSTVLRDVMGAVAIGVAAGLPLALGAGVITRSYLFDIEPRDGVTLTTACAVVLVAALVAAYMPARRALRIDPIAALRAE
jgi:hypothetical protein